MTTTHLKTYSKINHVALDFFHQIKTAAGSLDLLLTDGQVYQLLHYLDGLLLWNKAYNLTAISDPKDALVKHIFDCLAILPKLPFLDKQDICLLDIGTGAGLPAVILAIFRPDWQICALDSNNKKIRFIRQMAGELVLKNLTPVNERIENHQTTKPYDIITSRAFSSLNDFVSLAMPYLKTNGVFYAMKGKMPTEEDVQTLRAINPDFFVQTTPISVPGLNESRCVVYIKTLTNNKEKS